MGVRRDHIIVQMNPSPSIPSQTESEFLDPHRSTFAARSRVLWASCVAHALHDGYTDTIYVLLPIWQADFGLSYGALAALRGLYAGMMACLQLPMGRVADRFGSCATLVAGTLLAAIGFALVGIAGGLLGLCAALSLSGTGSSAQHPLASGAVSRAYGRDARAPLGIYNFSGDLGKAAVPAAVSLLVTVMPWRHTLWVISAIGMLVAAGLALFFRPVPVAQRTTRIREDGSHRVRSRGFRILFVIGVLDTAVRMGLLTFLPFLMRAKGASTPMIGTALALVFIGGAAGKFACGWLGTVLGVVGTTLATESATAALIGAILFTPMTPTLVLLPLLGVMLNGTSSVLYGTVPELSHPDRTEGAFALFYTGTIGAGAIAPVIYGFLGDWLGVQDATAATALTALAIVPMALALAPHLRTTSSGGSK